MLFRRWFVTTVKTSVNLASFLAIGLAAAVSHATIWDGGGVGGTDLGLNTNWAGDVLPSPNGGLAEWDGSVAGPLSLVYTTTTLGGSAGNSGLDLSVLATQTSALNLDSGIVTNALRLDDITIAAGAGAFSVGDTLNTFNITLGGTGGDTHTWANNSSNTATINSDVVFGLGGGGNHQFEFSGSGSWAVNNTIGGNISIRAIGTGTVDFNGNLSTGGTANLHVYGAAGVPVFNANAGSTIALSNGGNGSILIGNLVANTAGVFNQAGGTITLAQNLIMGSSGASNYGFYNKTAGTFTQTGSNRFRIGQGGGAGSAMLFYHSADSLSTTLGIALNDTSGATAGTGGAAVLYVTGGTMTGTAGAVGSTTTGMGIGGRQGRSEVSISSAGSVVLNSQTVLGGSVAGTPAAGDAGRVAVLNLGTGAAGGSLQTSQVSQDATAGALPLGYLNFNGGTLKAQTANATFLQGVTQATVNSAGGTIDNNGVAITIGQNLVGPTGNGVTGISVSGASGYRGAPYVQITGGGTPTTPATAVANLDGSGNVTSITITNPGSGYTSAPTVTLVGGGGAAGTLTPSVGAVASGGITFTGIGTTTLSGTNTYGGTSNISGGTKVVVTGSISGPVAVNAGILAGTGSVGNTTVANDPANTVANGNGGTGTLTLNALTFNGSAIVNATVGGTRPFTVTNTLTTTPANGQVTINGSGVWANGLNNLIGYGSLSGGLAGFNLGTIDGLNSRQVNNGLVLNGNNVALSISGDNPKWTGALSGEWSTNTLSNPKNWKLVTGGAVTDYIEGDAVVFDDSATGTTTVDINSGTVSPTSTVFNNSTKNYTIGSSISAGISGAGFLTKNGSGSVTISANNSYMGLTTINSGTLTLSGSNTNSGGTAFNGGALNINSSSALGTGALTIAAGSAKVLNNSSGSAITMTDNFAQTWNDDFTFTGSSDLDLGTGDVTMGGAGTNRTVSVVGTLTVGELRAVAHGLTKQGAGTLILTSTGTNGGANGSNLNGTLNVAAGTIQINRTEAAGGDTSTGDLTVTGLTGSGSVVNGAAEERWLFVNNPADTVFSGTLANGGTGALGLNKGGTGKLTLTGANSYSGTTTLNNGTLVLSNNSNVGAAALTAANYIVNGGNLVLAGTNSLGTTAAPTPGDPNNSASMLRLNNNNVSTLTFATDGGDTKYYITGGSGTAAAIVLDRATPGAGINRTLSTQTAANGVGNVTWNISSGANVTSGASRITFDQLGMGSGSVGTLLLNPTTASVTIGAAQKQNNDVSQTLGLGGTSQDNLVTGVISNGAALVTATNFIAVAKSNTSTWTLTGDNTYTGGTTVSGGTLLVNNTTGSGTGTGGVTVNSGGTLGGTGTIDTSSTNSNVTVAAGGSLAPGASAGTLTFNLGSGSLDLSAVTAGGLKFELGAPATPSASDHIVVSTGTLNLGTLDFGDFTFSNAGGLAAGTYTLFDAASPMAAVIGTASGTFGGFSGTLSLDNTNFNVLLTVTSAGVPGDYNNNGVVDAADYVLWRNGGPLQNEVDTPGTVNAADYAAWRARFGNTAGSGSGVGVSPAVPEPAACVLVLAGLLLIAVSRRGSY